MRAVVVGAGSWGSAFACLLRDRGHEVTLACRDPEQARAIAETGRNPRYLQSADLSGIAAAPIPEAPVGEADVVAVCVPSRAFADVVAALPGAAPVLSLTKGLDPATGEPPAHARRRSGRSPCSPARTSRRRSPPACPARR